MGEPQSATTQAVPVATHVDKIPPVTPDNEKYGDILHIEREDAQSETSGVMSASDMESALAELDNVRYVGALEDPLVVPTFMNLLGSHGTNDLGHLGKTVVIHDVAFIT